MGLTSKQSGVLKGMLIGVAISLAIVLLGAWSNPFNFQASSSAIERLEIAIQSALLPTLFLMLAVGRLAKHRFFTPQDIDGGGFSEDTERARVLQSLLQNTLEQCCIAFIVYLAWAVIMPPAWMSVVPLAALAFALGRVLFFAGYMKGAPSRALGFTLAFYPSVIMALCIVANMLWRI